jgi:hypothetical protein
MSEQQADYEKALRDAALRELRLAIGRCNPDTPADDITAILRNIIAAGLNEIDIGRLLKTLAGQTHDSIADLRKRFAGEQKTMRRATSAATEAQAKLVDEFNENFAVVNDGGKIVVMRRRRDPVMDRDVLERIEFSDFKKMFANRTLGPDEVAKVWLSHPDRNQYIEGIAFAPSGDLPEGWLNLWRGFAVEPAAGDWSLMQQHLLEVVCSNERAHYEYLLNWAAFAVRHPDRAAEVAVVLRGGKGCGKGIFGRWLRRMFGQHGMQITNAKHLVGNFNAHLRDCIFLFCDEAFWAGDKQHESVLKGLVTEDTIAIEGKGRDIVFVPNMLHILMASNADWVVPASSDERRYFVLDVAGTKMGKLDYFAALETQMQNGGAAAMLHDLHARDLSSFNIRQVPQTDALRSQKVLSLNSLASWWLTVLDRGYLYQSKLDIPLFAEWHDFYSTQLLYKSYAQWCDRGRRHSRSSDAELGRFMARIASRARLRGVHPVDEIDYPDRELLKAGGSLLKHGIAYRDRPPGYLCGTLAEARAAFAAAYPGTVDITDWEVVRDDQG